jgi:hypothetical protein
VEGLVVRGGQPLLDPPPRVEREFRFDSGDRPRTARCDGDFAIKVQWVELFAHLDRIGDGVIDVLQIKHGLPYAMELAQPPSPARPSPRADLTTASSRRAAGGPTR